MFRQEDFVSFLDEYKNKLVETNDMLKESVDNYRVKKLSVLYGLKDESTFNFFSSSRVGRRYLGIARYVLSSVGNTDYGTPEVKEVASVLLNKYFNTASIAPVYDPDLLDGYYKMLCDFTRRNKLERLKEEFDDVEVDLDSLRFVS